MKVSDKFIQALRATGKPIHRVAWEAGLTPNQVYKITSGVDRPEKDDPRIKKLCDFLKVPVSYAFEDEKAEGEPKGDQAV